MQEAQRQRDVIAERIYRDLDIRCSCGGPACGTGHAPDCDVYTAWDDAVAEADDELYELTGELS